jgi:hypothetical protein
MKVAKHQPSKTKLLLKPLPWLILTVLSAVVCIYALRSNNEHMNQLRDQVYAADKNGGDVQGALEKLAKYVTTNMNTNLSSGPNSVYPPIQLTNSYNKVTGSQAAAVEQQNSTLYTQAEDYCQATIPQGFSGRYRVPCIEQYVTSHSLQKGANTSTALYEFDFVSPTWSPDLAGWTLLLTILFAIITVVSFIIGLAVKTADKTKVYVDK